MGVVIEGRMDSRFSPMGIRCIESFYTCFVFQSFSLTLFIVPSHSMMIHQNNQKNIIYNNSNLNKCLLRLHYFFVTFRKIYIKFYNNLKNTSYSFIFYKSCIYSSRVDSFTIFSHFVSSQFFVSIVVYFTNNRVYLNFHVFSNSIFIFSLLC